MRITWEKKDWLDQPAHFFISAGLIAGFVLPLPIWIAALIVMIGAFIRELRQHDWDWRQVGRKDLLFIALGAAIAAFFFWRFK